MSAFSNYLEEKVIECTLRGATFPNITTVYVALFTSDPGETGDTGEVDSAGTWTDYERVDAAGGGAIATGWAASADGVTSNAKVIAFPAQNGGTPITVTHLALFDAATGGNMLYHSELAAPKQLNTGDVLSFNIGSIQVTVA